MVAIGDDCAAELVKLATRRAEQLMDAERDLRMLRIDFVGLGCRKTRAGDKRNENKEAVFHSTKLFNNADRDFGSLPNKFTSASAALLFKARASCTPAIRASSCSKKLTVRCTGSLALR